MVCYQFVIGAGHFMSLRKWWHEGNKGVVFCLKGTLWTTVLIVPAVIVLTAGFFYVYNAVLSLMTKTSLRNKVVVITDALSGLGTGKEWAPHRSRLVIVILLCIHLDAYKVGTPFQLKSLCFCRVCQDIPQGWCQADPMWTELGEAGVSFSEALWGLWSYFGKWSVHPHRHPWTWKIIGFGHCNTHTHD